MPLSSESAALKKRRLHRHQPRYTGFRGINGCPPQAGPPFISRPAHRRLAALQHGKGDELKGLAATTGQPSV